MHEPLYLCSLHPARNDACQKRTPLGKPIKQEVLCGLVLVTASIIAFVVGNVQRRLEELH